MKRLGLLRHAKSDWSDAGLRDFDRGLNDRGRRGAALMGWHIADHAAQHGFAWDGAIASTAKRVRSTLEASGLTIPVQWESQAYLATGAMLVELLQRGGGMADSVLLVGHDPGLPEVIFALVAPEQHNALFDQAAEKYPTAGFAVLELDIEDWNDCHEGCGRLVHFARPRDLDPELGPEPAGNPAVG